MAEQLIRLSGKEPGIDIKIAYTGLRPGEKLHEELFHNEENLSSTDYEKILLAETRFVKPELVDQVFGNIIEKLDSYDTSLSDCIQMLVPEYASLEEAEERKQKSA